jgi:ABC-type Zn uptake system ZnuABC Zn-binding protein ZnuA
MEHCNNRCYYKNRCIAAEAKLEAVIRDFKAAVTSLPPSISVVTSDIYAKLWKL